MIADVIKKSNFHSQISFINIQTNLNQYYEMNESKGKFTGNSIRYRHNPTHTKPYTNTMIFKWQYVNELYIIESFYINQFFKKIII